MFVFALATSSSATQIACEYYMCVRGCASLARASMCLGVRAEFVYCVQCYKWGLGIHAHVLGLCVCVPLALSLARGVCVCDCVCVCVSASVGVGGSVGEHARGYAALLVSAI